MSWPGASRECRKPARGAQTSAGMARALLIGATSFRARSNLGIHAAPARGVYCQRVVLCPRWPSPRRRPCRKDPSARPGDAHLTGVNDIKYNDNSKLIKIFAFHVAALATYVATSPKVHTALRCLLLLMIEAPQPQPARGGGGCLVASLQLSNNLAKRLVPKDALKGAHDRQWRRATFQGCRCGNPQP
jgi:hypothetical protein